MRVNLPRHGLNGISRYPLQLWHNLFHNIQLNILWVQILLKFWVRQLVPRFKLSIIITLLLHSIIGQVDQPVGDILQAELLAARPEVSLIVPVTLQIPIHCGQQCVAPNIELSLPVEHWLLDVFLYNVRPLLPIDHGSGYNVLYRL